MLFESVAPPLRRPSRAAAAAEIEGLFAAFDRLLGARVTLHDYADVLAWQPGDPLLKAERLTHSLPFCAEGRLLNPDWNRNCTRHCYTAVKERAGQGAPFVHHCWKGGAELVFPVMRRGNHLLTFFAGVFQGQPSVDQAVLASRVLRTRRRQLAELDAERLPRQLSLLESLAENVLRFSRSLQQGTPDRRDSIADFLAGRHTEPVGLPDLARALGLSPSHCSREVVRLFGTPFHRLLLAERVRRAAVLLGSTQLGVGEISLKTGFVSEYHFNRAFRQAYGQPPARWRKAHAAETQLVRA